MKREKTKETNGLILRFVLCYYLDYILSSTFCVHRNFTILHLLEGLKLQNCKVLRILLKEHLSNKTLECGCSYVELQCNQFISKSIMTKFSSLSSLFPLDTKLEMPITKLVQSLK